MKTNDDLSLRKRILIVDDEPGFTRLLRLNFHHTGRYTAEVVNDASLALETAERFTPDIILLDVMMPGLDGGEIATRIRASPKLRDTPIVFLTAAIRRQELAGREGRCGGLPCLAKPVEFKEVLRQVDGQCGFRRYL